MAIPPWGEKREARHFRTSWTNHMIALKPLRKILESNSTCVPNNRRARAATEVAIVEPNFHKRGLLCKRSEQHNRTQEKPLDSYLSEGLGVSPSYALRACIVAHFRASPRWSMTHRLLIKTERLTSDQRSIARSINPLERAQKDLSSKGRLVFQHKSATLHTNSLGQVIH